MGNRLRACGWPGCKELVPDGGVCPAHKSKQNAERMGPDHSSIYDAKWERVRNQARRAEPLCGECRASGIVDQRTQEVDHVFAVRNHPHLRLVLLNLQGCCRAHHAAKTVAETSSGEFSAYQAARRKQVSAALLAAGFEV